MLANARRSRNFAYLLERRDVDDIGRFQLSLARHSDGRALGQHRNLLERAQIGAHGEIVGDGFACGNGDPVLDRAVVLVMRMLGEMAAVVARLSRSGVPARAILMSTTFGYVAVVMNYISPEVRSAQASGPVCLAKAEAVIARSWPRPLDRNFYLLSIVRIAPSGSRYRRGNRDAGPCQNPRSLAWRETRREQAVVYLACHGKAVK